jgi:putative transposase
MKLTKVMRYEIIKPINETWETVGKILREIQHDSWLLANRTIQMLWDFQNLSFAYKERFGEYLKMSDLPNKYKSNAGDIQNQMRQTFYRLPSGTFDTVIKKANEKWSQHKSKILKGEESIVNFKKDFPIQIRDRQIKVHKSGSDYYITLGLLSKEYAKELGRKPGETQFTFLISVRDKTQQVILDRLMNGQYKVGGSELFSIKKGKTKWMLNLSYTFESQEKQLDKDKIMGIDLGIVNALYIAFNDSLERFRIEGGEIDAFRKRVEARRKSMLRQGKYCGEGRIGHGRQTRIKPIEKLSEKVENFRKSCNHKYSRTVVDLAVKHGCGTIQMEDLTGISKDEKFLKNWSYYDLQQKIEYKAQEAGIQVVYIKPDYTSQRCSKCGHIERENRPEQAEFQCKSCGFKTNADYNAARNIATKNIDKIIAALIK